MNDLDQFQIGARRTAVYPGRESMAGLTYCTLGLCGESGEFAEKVKKCLRDNGGKIDPPRLEALVKELGDVMWYVANAAAELRVLLSEVAQANRTKLLDRKVRGALHGEGDTR
jgi:NTP pyrophosphatase (non-canonical NTP hydrolase)